jgi:hypothetical protein
MLYLKLWVKYMEWYNKIASNKTTGKYGYTARVWDGVADNR